MYFRTLLVLVCCAALTTAQDKKAKPKPAPKPSTTHHKISIGDKQMEYAATAGYLMLKEDGGGTKAEMFHISYVKWDGGVDTKRPVTFVFNGGPGAASVWLHMGGVGPRRVAMTDDGMAPKPPARVVDCPDTWLASSDLVFIDPVGTGYSRPAKGHKQSEFSGLEEDTRSVAEFIRAWVTENNRWESPKFLAGESYGTTRAASVASSLRTPLAC